MVLATEVGDMDYKNLLRMIRTLRKSSKYPIWLLCECAQKDPLIGGKHFFHITCKGTESNQFTSFLHFFVSLYITVFLFYFSVYSLVSLLLISVCILAEAPYSFLESFYFFLHCRQLAFAAFA